MFWFYPPSPILFPALLLHAFREKLKPLRHPPVPRNFPCIWPWVRLKPYSSPKRYHFEMDTHHLSGSWPAHRRHKQCPIPKFGNPISKISVVTWLSIRVSVHVLSPMPWKVAPLPSCDRCINYMILDIHLWLIDGCQSKVSTDQYRVWPVTTGSSKEPVRVTCFCFILKLTADQVLVFSSGSWAQARLPSVM